MEKDNFEKWLEERVEFNRKAVIDVSDLPDSVRYFNGKVKAYETTLWYYRQFKQAEPCKP